jgi:hypothetical protein
LYLEAFRIANRSVTCREYLEFMSDDGYARREFWLSEGWEAVRKQGWRAPLYWERDATNSTGWRIFTLRGWHPGNLLHTGRLHPAIASGGGLNQLFGDSWEWTASPYTGYPGYKPFLGPWANIRQVYVWPDDSAWRVLRHASDSHTHNLSQFLSAGDALAIHGNTFGHLRTLKYEYHDRFSDIRSERPRPVPWERDTREALIDEVGTTLAMYIGSSIGNFSPEEARTILRNLKSELRAGDALLLGTDMVKDEATLGRACDDKDGVTAAFNLNILHRLKRELGANFDTAASGIERAGIVASRALRCTWRVRAISV